MGFGGSVSAMIQSLRNNGNLAGKRKGQYFNKKTGFLKTKTSISDQKATQEELDLVKAKMLKQNQREFRVKIIAIVIAAITCLFVCIAFITH